MQVFCLSELHPLLAAGDIADFVSLQPLALMMMSQDKAVLLLRNILQPNCGAIRARASM